MSQAEHPLVSVLLPVRNGMPDLVHAVESILAQSYSSWEFLCLDDGSTDATAAYVAEQARRDSRIQLHSTPPRGMRNSLNHGIQIAKGEYVARLDSDDIALPNRFALQVAYLQTHPQINGVGGHAWAIDADGETLFSIRQPTDPQVIEQRLLQGQNPLLHPAMMLRTKAIAAVGGYEDGFYPSEDYGLWLRMTEHGQLANLDAFLIKYRLHAATERIDKHELQLRLTRQLLAAAYTRRGLGTPPDLPADFSPRTVDAIHHHWAMSAAKERFAYTARKHAWLALRARPWKPHRWWTMLKAVLYK